MFQNVITLAGANQFSAATPVATFLEAQVVTTFDATWAPRIFGYSYSALGSAHTVTLRLSPAVGSAVNLQIVLETPTAATNNFTEICGRNGLVLPRQYGRTNSNTAVQTIDTNFGAPNNAAPLVLLFTTTGKDGDATFRVWWDYVMLGGN